MISKCLTHNVPVYYKHTTQDLSCDIIPPVRNQSKPGLTNLWHTYPKWQTESFLWHEAFTVVPIFYFFGPSIVSNICVCVCVCIYIFLTI